MYDNFIAELETKEVNLIIHLVTILETILTSSNHVKNYCVCMRI